MTMITYERECRTVDPFQEIFEMLRADSQLFKSGNMQAMEQVVPRLNDQSELNDNEINFYQDVELLQSHGIVSFVQKC
ncbi:hypothetical protein X798_01563 [Onchocerca flexuosa]|uniref:Uncharacterized protein n=1 Tax=Onchocerca flexuosa TaxID=387005 RepID=A0A238C3Q9_9BILA|nr:hypothetical protein X798_01563 [Onchocerca flexuosa]